MTPPRGSAGVRPTAGNPCAGGLERAYTIGVSQTGRFLRHLLYLGLNEDETGRQVFDGVFVHIAGARRGEFNQRFGQPSLNATSSVGSLFPFTDTAAIDPVTGERGAQLARLEARGILPKIVAVNTSAEYWRGDASLVHADVEGTRDVRRTRRLGSTCSPAASTRPAPCLRRTPIPTPARAACRRSTWSTTRPSCGPCSRISIAGSTASSRRRAPCRGSPTGRECRPRARGGVRTDSRGFASPTGSSGPRRLDFGPNIARGIVHELPPKIGAPFVTFVPSVDDDGNDIPGIRAVELGAPLATFTGWNPRHPDQGVPGDLMSMLGSTVPFAGTRAAREASGDPRPSIEERYASRAAYLARAREAAVRLVAERHMLAEDVDACGRAGRTALGLHRPRLNHS